MADLWELYKGQKAQIAVTLRDSTGSPVTSWSGTESLSLQVWEGDDQAPVSLPNSNVTWTQASQGTLTITFDAADLLALAAQPYRLVVWLTTTQRIPVYEALISIKAAPGTATAPAVYATYDDMKKVALFMDRLIVNDPGQLANMAEYLGSARQWLDRQILSRAQRILESQYERHYPTVAIVTPAITTGVDTGPDWGASIYPQADVDTQLTQIKALLDANALDLTDGMARRLCARWAVAELCASQIGNANEQTSYQSLAAKYRNDAIRGLIGFTARITTGGTPATLVF